MIHHFCDLAFRIETDIGSFWNDSANEFMVVFARTFLAGSRRITIKNPGTKISLVIFSSASGLENSVPLSANKIGNSFFYRVLPQALHIND